MKFRNVLVAAGLSLTIAGFAPPVLAQVGGAGSGATGGLFAAPSSPGMPAAGNSGTAGVFQQAPSTGQPGTQAPASAAPIGTSTSDWMSYEGRSAAENSSVFPSAATTNEEKRLRADEKTLERDLAAYRATGYNIQPAKWEKWLGSEALARGDQVDAASHFQRAAMDLRRLSETGAYALRPNYSSDASLHGSETSQMTNASDMHSNKSSRAAY